MTWTRGRRVGGPPRPGPGDASTRQADGNRHATTDAHAAAMDSALPRPGVVDLVHTDAGDASLTGAKAANLAIAQRAGLPVLPGMVLTTAWDHTGWWHPSRLHDGGDSSAWTAWHQMSEDGRRPVVVRSSSTNEDGGTSSMAGVFTSVLNVSDRMSFVHAVDEVLASAHSGLIAGAPMAVLVQPQLSPRWGGVLFGAATSDLVGPMLRELVDNSPGTKAARDAIAQFAAADAPESARSEFDRLAAAARRVEHHPHLDVALLRRDHCGEQRRVGEQKHFDAQRLLRRRDRIDDRPGGVVGHDDQ